MLPAYVSHKDKYKFAQNLKAIYPAADGELEIIYNGYKKSKNHRISTYNFYFSLSVATVQKSPHENPSTMHRSRFVLLNQYDMPRNE